jgi:hypothetical protein
MRISGAGCAAAMELAMDQIFSLAAWIRPPMLPVVSRTNTTSIRDRSLASGLMIGGTAGGGSTGVIPPTL